MSDMIGDGLAWLAAELKANASTTFTYRRGSYTVALSVTIGQPKFGPLTVLAGVMADRDLSQSSPDHADHWLWFTAADLILNGSLTTPQLGDTIEQAVAGVTRVYTLSRCLDGTRWWGYDNNDYRNMIFVNGRLKSVT